ncbi:geraniol 8-hydroxylase-like isoform X2 [Iris pallida]|uniref:Geraniol 8-hydroxylase-like isoform X2 n=1 Tax=Iris pallida TaxID=29817 RepID=A0AAX6GDM0_IRIPA|nr:geraniol 8-hydroxylase-like isoform X2 [Iris pallida]
MAELHYQWLLILASSLLSLAYVLTRKRLHLPPGPKPLPVIGNLLSLGDNPHRSLAALAKTYGPVMTLKLGQATTIVVSSAALAREVLLKKDQAFCNRSVPDAIHVLRHSELSIAWLPPNQMWKSLRKIYSTQLFTSQRFEANKDLRKEKVQELVAYLTQQGSAGEPVDVGRAIFTTVLNSISNTLFSVDMVGSYSESVQGFRDLLRGIMAELAAPNVSDFFPILARLDLQGNRRRSEKCAARFHEIFDELIDKRLLQEEEKESGKDVGAAVAKDFLDTLISILVKGDAMELDRPAMKSFLLDVFLAGVDTTTSMLEWVMAELLRNPSSMASARAELAKALNMDNVRDESYISKLPYLQAVLKETLRLHPPIPFLLPRSTASTVDLCGYTIPAGTRVLVNCWAIGRDDTVWTDRPEMFVPERFLGMDVDYKGQDFELVPFGAGRRICPGLPLAFRMVPLLLASLLRSFDWKLANGQGPEDVDLTEKLGITVAKSVPIRAIPYPDLC